MRSVRSFGLLLYLCSYKLDGSIIDCKGTAHELWEEINRLYGDSSKCEYAKVKEDDPKEEAHEC